MPVKIYKYVCKECFREYYTRDQAARCECLGLHEDELVLMDKATHKPVFDLNEKSSRDLEVVGYFIGNDSTSHRVIMAVRDETHEYWCSYDHEKSRWIKDRNCTRTLGSYDSLMKCRDELLKFEQSTSDKSDDKVN